MRGRLTVLVLVLLLASVGGISATAPAGAERAESQDMIGFTFQLSETPQDAIQIIENSNTDDLRSTTWSAGWHSGGSNYVQTDGRNASTIHQLKDDAREGAMLLPANEDPQGVLYSVNRPPELTSTFRQPSGQTFEAQFWSAGVTAGWRTDDGYTIIKAEDGYWYYAIKSNGRLVPSSARVGIAQVPASTPTKLVPSVMTDRASTDGTAIGVDEVPSTGTQEIPVVGINFNDTSTSYSPSEFQSLLFGDDPSIATGPGSVTDYYEEVSSGQLTLTGNVSGWETADNNESYYGGGGTGDGGRPDGAAELVKEAAQKADNRVNFAQYDNDNDCIVDQFAVIHQGGGQEVTNNPDDIWSHRWFLSAGTDSRYESNDSSPGCTSIYVDGYTIQPETLDGQMVTIGVYAHEFGHGLGLPDLYDTDGSSAGIGNWGLMGTGSYGEVSQLGDAPNHMIAWSKAYLDWLDPVEITSGEARDEVTLRNVSKNNDYLKLLNETDNKNGEYFYIENRQETGFDQGLPGEGLLVSHVNESRIADDCIFFNTCNDDEENKLVDIEAADGKTELDKNRNRGDVGDLWSENTGPFDESSTPSSEYDNGSSSDAAVSTIRFSAGSAQGAATLNASVKSSAKFIIDIVETNTPVEGEELNVTANIENTGDTQDTQTVEMSVGALGSNSTSLALGGGNSTTVTLSVETGSGDAGEYTATVSSVDGTASANVTVDEPSLFDVMIISVDSVVKENETVTVSYNVTNTGDVQATQNVTFAVDGAVENDTGPITLNASKKFTGQFSYDTKTGDSPAVVVAVSSDDDSASETVTVNKPPVFEVAITGIDSAVTEGETVTVAFEVTNTGNVQATQDIIFSINGTTEDTKPGITLNGSETFSGQFTYHTSDGDTPVVSATVASVDSTATENVTVDPLTIANYANDDNIIEVSGLLNAIDDFRGESIETALLLDVIDAFRSGEPVI